MVDKNQAEKEIKLNMAGLDFMMNSGMMNKNEMNEMMAFAKENKKVAVDPKIKQQE